MKKIIGIINPFLNNHNFYVYEDGNKIDAIDININNINNIFKLIEEYDIQQIDLTGPKAYTAGIKKQLLETNLTKYNKELEITLI